MYITLQRLIKDPQNEGKKIEFGGYKYMIINNELNRYYEVLGRYLPVYLPHQPEHCLDKIEEALSGEK